MIAWTIVLCVAFVIVRFLIERYPSQPLVANGVAGALVLAFVVGSLTHAFEFPHGATASDVAPPTDAPPAVVADVHDVSSSCKSDAKVTSGGTGSFDSFAQNDAGLGQVSEGGSVKANLPYVAVGWAADSTSGLAKGVCLALDGRLLPQVSAEYGFARADVAKNFNSSALGASGFEITVPPNTLPKGRHRLIIAVLSANGAFQFAPSPLTVTVH